MTDLQDKIKLLKDDILKKQNAERANKKYDRAPTWKPTEAGSQLMCQVIEVFPTPHGDRRRVVADNGKQWTLPSSKLVQAELFKTQAKVGDVVWLQYDGEKKCKNSAYTYKVYQIAVISKDAAEASGLKFPEPLPLPEQKSAQEAPKEEPKKDPVQEESKLVETLKKVVDIAGKRNGMDKEEFVKLVKNVTGTEKTIDELVIEHSSIIEYDETGKKIIPAKK